MNCQSEVNLSSIKRLVKAAAKGSSNRVYYESYFNETDIRRMGIVQSEEKTKLDKVALDPDKSESLHFFGFTQNDGSYFELNLTIASLNPECHRETQWRLGRVKLLLDLGAASGGKFVYEHEQLLDYDQKRRHPDRHENLNVYALGALTVETVLAFSFTRILFNGLMRVEDGQRGHRLRPMRLAISTHPTCDKFDYKYRFDSTYTTAIIGRSMLKSRSSSQESDGRQLLELVLEDRFDQPLMFQGRLESLDESSGEARPIDESFVMWGAKVKSFADARGPAGEARDCLFAWTECGHQVHLSRPRGWPSLVYGMVHNSYDYASHLYEASLWRLEGGVEKAAEFGDLDSFDELTSSHVIRLKAFRIKDYKLEFKTSMSSASGDKSGQYRKPIRIKVNSFNGWATSIELDLGREIKRSQDKLLLMRLNDDRYTFKLAHERMLGGKGQSLVDLSRLVYEGRFAQIKTGEKVVQVSVPRGLVLTSEACRLWLESDPRNTQAICELNATRLKLAAKSVSTNPLSDEYLAIGEAQRLLREKCQTSFETLVASALPAVISRILTSELTGLFGDLAIRDDELGGAETRKMFAVRSSAVGEDSLETSAAGQMRTILNVRGLKAISRAVVECWASQFLLEALTYKSQNGLDFCLPMAVVVQELVECRVAGVAATCNPMTGNRRQLEIVANVGLGEGVVAGGRADTVRITSDRLDDQTDGRGSWRQEAGEVEKLTAGGSVEECCLSDEQIEALANLLLEVRRTSELQDREVEWGITFDPQLSSSTSSSSSSSSDDGGRRPVQIHLFQSRPLTNLQRLSKEEIAHELDDGAQSGFDLCSRANLGEVMPGALCALNQSWFMPVVASYLQMRPDLKDFTRSYHSMGWIGFYSHMAISILTNSWGLQSYNDENQKRGEIAQAVTYSMVGTTFNRDTEDSEQLSKFCKERKHPATKQMIEPSLGILLSLDMGICQTLVAFSKRASNTTKLHEDLPSLEEEWHKMKGLQDYYLGAIGEQFLIQRINQLFERLITRFQPITRAWVCHILASATSVGFNAMSLKIISEQPAYDGRKLTDSELLNDWTTLVRGDIEKSLNLRQLTESGDISKLLDRMLECFTESNQIDELKQMQPVELYKSLCANKLFADFMQRNGHRAWKEFCLSTRTWRDDPSYIVKLLAARLRSYSAEEAQRERARKLNADREHEARLAQVLAKLTSNRLLLLNYALPRARSATIRRESSKSLLIKAIDKYRQAFRHLAGLMCLVGLLPSAELIFFLTIEELDEIVRKCCAERPDERQPRDSVMPRLLYKARRRQQHCRLFDRVTFPRPTLTVNEMFETIRQQTQERRQTEESAAADAASSTGAHDEPAAEVRGITSCAGRVTGRACVISSLDEVDQLEEGDILVTYSIDISWSVYFFMLGGIVTEVGGIVSHGAVVAREYGLPTLCTAVGACSRFKTGQMITLDANKGVCRVASNVETTV